MNSVALGERQQRLLDDPDLPALLVPGGRLILGHARRDQVEIPATWNDRKQLNHGDTIIRFLELPEPPGSGEAVESTEATEGNT